ncbi:hypothetical protein Naga_101639g1 [Nannochloropsis gaditana]|uniref:Uncharacterized protein n=1 Tax=Nannochloropsis gaditana TaxID=72520 RepID=W7TWA7_9STRA|nr:hypothetical protein Naga_101639g1 [Nannochloropsis gaditana]
MLPSPAAPSPSALQTLLVLMIKHVWELYQQDMKEGGKEGGAEGTSEGGKEGGSAFLSLIDLLELLGGTLGDLPTGGPSPPSRPQLPGY